LVDEPNEGEYDEGGDEVVGLVVEQVVHHPVPPLLRVADVRHFEPETVSDHVLLSHSLENIVYESKMNANRK
jgi:hypothetical protein